MIDLARRTKDLSIALEVLSRIVAVGDEFDRVRNLLRDTIIEQEQGGHRQPTVKIKSPPNLDDEIPF